MRSPIARTVFMGIIMICGLLAGLMGAFADESSSSRVLPASGFTYEILEGSTLSLDGTRPDVMIELGGKVRSLTLDYHDTVIGQLGGPPPPPYEPGPDDHDFHPNLWSGVFIPDDARDLDRTAFGRDDTARNAAIFAGLRAAVLSGRALDLLARGNNPGRVHFRLSDIPLADGLTMADFRDTESDSAAMEMLYRSAAVGQTYWFTTRVSADIPEIITYDAISEVLHILKSLDTSLQMEAANPEPFWNVGTFVFNGLTGTRPDSAYVDGVLFHVLPAGSD